jgi:hypothetical protein
MTSSLMVRIRAMLFNLPCGTTQRIGSSGSQQEVWGWIVRWLHRCLRLRASATTFAFQGDNELLAHNPWSVIAIFVVSCLDPAEWTYTSDSCDLCRCALDYPINSASRLSMHERQPRALGHRWGSALHGVAAIVKHRQLHNHFASIRL